MARIRARSTDQRQVERDLEESERRHQAFVDQLPAIVYTAEAGGAGQWRFVSHQVETMLGYTPHEWVADPSLWADRLHPDDRERVIEARLAVEVGARFEAEYRFCARDRQVLWVRDEAVKVRLPDGMEVLTGMMLDVTGRRQAEAALAASEQQYRHLVETSNDLIWSLDAGGVCTFVNDAARKILGYEPEEMIGRPFTDFTPPGQSQIHLAAVERALAGRAGPDEAQHRRKDGSVVVLSHTAVPVRDDEGRVIGATGSARDVTAARQTHARLQAIIDHSPVMIFTLDRQHRIVLANDEFERLVGLPKGELIGRTPDDVLPPEAAASVRAGNEQVMATGERRETEESIPNPGGHGGRTFISQRFPLRDAHGEIDGLGVVLTDISERKEREQELLSRVEWSSRIREAIASDRFTLHAQPIVDLSTGARVQEELLIRMKGEDGALVMPGEFLPAAERFGLAPEIDRWVVTKAAAMARHRRVEVNLSGKSIGDPTVAGFIEVELAAAGADPANVVFEITETAAAGDIDQARRLAERLTRLGCGFALDDFGTGFGSFTYLKNFPVSFIKIDYEFVRTMAQDDANHRVVHSMIGVARDFGIETIAEGVESAETLQLLKEMGVDYAQGFHIGRPAPAIAG